MASIKHIHTYAKLKGKQGYFMCRAPNCSHYTKRELIIGKYSLCNICGAQFQLTYRDLERAQPRCINCSDTKQARLAKKAKELTRYLGTDAFSQQPNLPFGFELPFAIHNPDDEAEVEAETEDDTD